MPVEAAPLAPPGRPATRRGAAGGSPPAAGGFPPLPGPLREWLRTYYHLPAVRARLLEFLGGETPAEASAPFVVTAPTTLERPFRPTPTERLWEAVDRDLELSRSLWDRAGLLAHLDLEHVCFDRPWETFENPARSFALQEPVAAAVETWLATHGIAPLHVLTGRGHHWVWRVERGSAVLADLAALGERAAPARGDRWSEGLVGEVVPPALAAAHHGLGMVLEHTAHVLLRQLMGTTRAPLQVTAVTVGPGEHGREIVSLDLSEYGDPLVARTIRAPFSLYLKGWRMGRLLMPRLPLAPLVPVVVPAGMGLAEALATRRPARAAELARRVSATIPDGTTGTAALIAAYRASPVAAFHDWFHATAAEPPERWAASYDRLDLDALPPCARLVLERPNDLILRPAQLQLLVRVLLARAWHPRHVAGLVCSKLERDHGWLGPLHFFDAAVRADFYVRLFAGLALLECDPLIDFTCTSTAEKEMCPAPGCGCNLAVLRDRLRRAEPPWHRAPEEPGQVVAEAAPWATGR